MSDTDLLERPVAKATEKAHERDQAAPAPHVSSALLARQLAAVADLERLRDEMIALLDELNGEPDLEDDASAEWSLGSLCGTGASAGGGCQLRWSDGAGFDLEEAHDGREPQCEDEGAQCDDEGSDCEDEGGACEDEGFECDREAEEYEGVPAYGVDQTRPLGDLFNSAHMVDQYPDWPPSPAKAND